MFTSLFAGFAIKQVKKRYGSGKDDSSKPQSVGMAGVGYVMLNAMRVCNIIAFVMVIAACVVMLVKTQTSSRFFFFDALSHVITLAICLFLIVSEVGLLQSYFERHWPSFSPSHGFVTLGVAMIAIGTEILGNLNKSSNTQKALGMAFWRIVIASGILVMIFGVFNIIFNFIFRDRVSGVTAREVRARGKIAITDARAHAAMRTHEKFSGFETTTHHTGSSTRSMLPRTPEQQPKRSSHRWTHRFSKPILPTYQKATSPVASSRYSPRSNAGPVTDSGQPPMNISGPLNMNPQFSNLPGLKRPDSAYHPAMQPYPGRY